MARARIISDWPKVKAAVRPATLAALQAEAEARSVPVAQLVREALDRSVLPSAPLGVGRTTR